MTTFYNDNDPKVCAWLAELERRHLISPGVVDSRSILDLRGSDLAGFNRVHLFAGIGGWDYALQLAGWPTTLPVWTGSCPCQPFSVAGKRKGTADDRHLWPEMLRLVSECRPSTIFGEQVASRAGRDWLSGVRADLEALGYAVGAADLCAAGVGAPHIRQRLYWVAHAERERARAGESSVEGCSRIGRPGPSIDGSTRGLGNPGGDDVGRIGGSSPRAEAECDCERIAIGAVGDGPRLSSATGGLGDAEQPRLERLARDGDDGNESGRIDAEPMRSTAEAGGALPGFWSRSELIPCGDGKARRIEPGTPPLAHGVPARVVRLRGYGNSIVAPLAAVFIRSAMECLK